MAPHSEEVPLRPADPGTQDNIAVKGQTSLSPESTTKTQYPKPLELKGVLDQFRSFDVTPVIGKEFPDANVAEWLRAPNSDELLRDLAIIGSYLSSIHISVWLIVSDRQPVSQRGVVFFRAQDGLDDNLQKELAQRLGELSGKPASSKLHIHPVVNAGREHGGKDDEISIISSVQSRKIFKGVFDPDQKKQSGKGLWHSDITFEPIPSDYAILRLTELPRTGGGKFSILLGLVIRKFDSKSFGWIRYPLGIGIRSLRSHLGSIPEIP